MIKKEHVIIAALLIIILTFSILIITALQGQTDNSQSIYRETLANDPNDPGTVDVIRNIGNPDGEKIAYVVGVHPLEHLTHETLVRMLPNMTGLNNCYDVYIINVTEDVGYYGDGLENYENPGRQNGQNLAYKYVYPEIAQGNYKMAIDVHSNIGAYPYKTFVFSPVNDGLGVKYAQEVADNCQDIDYYSPDTTTSGPFLTIPLNENGVPSFYFEEFSFATPDVKDEHMLELIRAVDALD